MGISYTPGQENLCRELRPYSAMVMTPEAPLESPCCKVLLNVVVMQQDYVRHNQLKRHPRGALRSVAVMGHTYPGPGYPIGSAMASGRLAALHIAERPR